MADTFTTNYNWTKPQVGGDPDTWGGLLNTNFDGIDSTVYAVQTTANAAMPKTGGTFTGSIAVQPASGGATLVLASAAGSNRFINFQTGGLARWAVITDNSAESGSNAGSNFAIYRNSDAGTFIDTPFSISRSSGIATFSQRPVFAGQTPWDAGNFNPANYAPLAGATFTGAVNLNGATTTNGGLNTYSGSVGSLSVLQQFGWNNAVARWQVVFDTSANYQLWSHDSSGGSATARLTVNNSTGVVSAVDFQATSDERLKKFLGPLKAGYAELKRIAPEHFLKYVDRGHSGKGHEEVGFRAQKVQTILPSAVEEAADGTLTVSIMQLVALVANAVLQIGRALELEGII